MRFRLIATLEAVALVALWRALHLTWSVVSGPLSYMGATDARTIKTGLAMYGGAIATLVGRLYLADLLVHLALLAPLTPWFLPWLSRQGRRGVLKTAGLAIVVQGLWVGAAALRIPTLFAHLYTGDVLWQGVFAALCSRAGLAVLVGVAAALFGLLALAVGWRRWAWGVGAYAIGVALLARVELAPLDLELPEGSVVLLVADSLRLDAVTPERLPELSELIAHHGATIIPAVVPPVPRTGPALTALLTGKLPFESGVSTMFSPGATFGQTDSLVSRYRAAGYCTVAVTEYPGEFLRKIDLGFERLEAPIVRFREIIAQTVLGRDPFVLATASYEALLAMFPRGLQNLVQGLPTFADGHGLLRRFAAQTRACGGRPVFALVFADQPHFPYVQTWPHYLALDPAYRGPSLFAKDPTSRADDADRQRARDLYWASLRASDATLAAFVRQLGDRGQLAGVSVIVTGDHGESLYETPDLLGHGDQLTDLVGIAVPWIAFGNDRERFAGPSPRASLALSRTLLELRGLAVPPRLASPDVVYSETGDWLANTPSIPADRVPYPELAALLVEGPGRHIEINPAYVRAVELAKHRLWLVDGSRYLLEPLVDRVRLTRDGVEITPAELPPSIKAFLARAPHVFAPLLGL